MERDRQLRDAGYEVFHVNEESYNSVEAELNTDLSEIGLDPQQSYLVVASGEPGENSNTVRGAATTPFTYTYNGTSYQMRYLTVSPKDSEADPKFVQSSKCDLLESSSQTIIKNVINTAISVCISSLDQHGIIGTIASIIGLDIDDFLPNAQATLGLVAMSTWTRKYTQVYSPYDNAWSFRSCVEFVNMDSTLYGYYYDVSIHDSVDVNESRRVTMHSSQFFNNDWCKSQAAYAFESGLPCRYNLTGDAKYYYGNSVKITHRENF